MVKNANLGILSTGECDPKRKCRNFVLQGRTNFLGVNPDSPVPSFTMSAMPAGANSTLPWVDSKMTVRRKKHETAKSPQVSPSVITQYNAIFCFMRARVLRALSSVVSHVSAASHLIKSGCLPRPSRKCDKCLQGCFKCHH